HLQRAYSRRAGDGELLRSAFQRDPLDDRGEGGKGHRQPLQRRADHGADPHHQGAGRFRADRLPRHRRGRAMNTAGTLYDWPPAAAFGRVIPKNKIYEHAGANTALKDLFVREVDQIVWSHKLAPETINLAATRQV